MLVTSSARHTRIKLGNANAEFRIPAKDLEHVTLTIHCIICIVHGELPGIHNGMAVVLYAVEMFHYKHRII